MCSGMRRSTAGCCWSRPGRGARHFCGRLYLCAIGVVEKIVFHTSYFATMLGNRFGGGQSPEFDDHAMMVVPLTALDVGNFLISPGLWIGLAFAALFLAAAVRLRRYREPI